MEVGPGAPSDRRHDDRVPSYRRCLLGTRAPPRWSHLADLRSSPARSGWTWHPLGGTGARLADPGQPGHGVAPSYAERPCGGRRGN